MKTNYDPVKRREYYLRTRQLKGRPSKSPPESSGVGGFIDQKVTSLQRSILHKKLAKEEEKLRSMREQNKQNTVAYQVLVRDYVLDLQKDLAAAQTNSNYTKINRNNDIWPDKKVPHPFKPDK